MKIQNPCRNCTKRSTFCRIECVRYKVYHTAKLREYERKRKERAVEDDYQEIVKQLIVRKERHCVSFTSRTYGKHKSKP